jgi:hypothetical protein
MTGTLVTIGRNGSDPKARACAGARGPPLEKAHGQYVEAGRRPMRENERVTLRSLRIPLLAPDDAGPQRMPA